MHRHFYVPSLMAEQRATTAFSDKKFQVYELFDDFHYGLTRRLLFMLKRRLFMGLDSQARNSFPHPQLLGQ